MFRFDINIAVKGGDDREYSWTTGLASREFRDTMDILLMRKQWVSHEDIIRSKVTANTLAEVV